MKLAFVVVAALAAAFAVAQAQEDKKPEASVEALIKEGLAAYQKGDHQAAIARLQKAIGIIQKAAEKGLASFLPAPAEGWKADPPKSNSGSWGAGEEAVQWTQVVRTYKRESDGLEVEMTLSNSPQIVQGQRMAMQAFRNPQMLEMMNKDPNNKITLIDEDGWKGWTQTEKGKRAQTMAICESVLLIIEVPADDEATRTMFWNALDRKGLASSVAPAK